MCVNKTEGPTEVVSCSQGARGGKRDGGGRRDGQVSPSASRGKESNKLHPLLYMYVLLW